MIFMFTRKIQFWFEDEFLCPRDRRSRAYCFFPVCYSVLCHSVLLSETLTLLKHFEQWVLELWYFTWVFLVITSFFYPVTFTLEFDPFFENFNLANDSWTVNAIEHWYFTGISLVMRYFCWYLTVWNLTFDEVLKKIHVALVITSWKYDTS